MTQKAERRKKAFFHVIFAVGMQNTGTVNQKQKLKRLSEKFQKYFLCPFEMQVAQRHLEMHHIKCNAMQCNTWKKRVLVNNKINSVN